MCVAKMVLLSSSFPISKLLPVVFFSNLLLQTLIVLFLQFWSKPACDCTWGSKCPHCAKPAAEVAHEVFLLFCTFFVRLPHVCASVCLCNKILAPLF